MGKFLTLSNTQLFWIGLAIVAAGSFTMGWTIHGWKRDASELVLMKKLDKAIDTGVIRQKKIDRLSAEVSNKKEAEIRIVYEQVLGEVKGATNNTGCLNTTGGSVWNRALQGRSRGEATTATPAEGSGRADTSSREGR